MHRTAKGWLIVAAACVWTAAAQAITAGEKCEADKLKTAGKYAFCRMNAGSKAIKKGEAPDYSRCDAKYGAKWGTVESKAGSTCPVTGDLGDIQTQATGCTDGLTASIGGNPPAGCTGDLLTCEGDLLTCEGDLTICDTDLTVCASDQAVCKTDLLAAELCGNGAIDAGEDCDLGTLNGATCVTESFTGGVLSCSNGCTFDTSGCFAARFVDNADGTITDNVSGLTWEKKTERNSISNLANPHDADNFYRWSGTCNGLTSKRCQPKAKAAALCAANVEGDPDGCAECTGSEGICDTSTTMWTMVAALNSTSFAGQTDWRAPTLQELQAIVDYTDTTLPMVNLAFQGGSCGVACTDITSAACSCTRTDSHWSASTYAPSPVDALIVNFGGGVSAFRKPDEELCVRAVRGGS
jgi:hypothetical protein